MCPDGCRSTAAFISIEESMPRCRSPCSRACHECIERCGVMCRELHLWRAGGLTANKPPRSSVETPMTSISHDTSTASDRASSVRCSERAFGPTGRPTLACACSGVGRAGLPTPDGRGRSSASSSTAPPSHSTELMVMAFALEMSVLRRRHSSSTRSSRVFAPTQGVGHGYPGSKVRSGHAHGRADANRRRKFVTVQRVECACGFTSDRALLQ
jgi:hypothetical protein